MTFFWCDDALTPISVRPFRAEISEREEKKTGVSTRISTSDRGQTRSGAETVNYIFRNSTALRLTDLCCLLQAGDELSQAMLE